jgi:hypothetical protein
MKLLSNWWKNRKRSLCVSLLEHRLLLRHLDPSSFLVLLLVARPIETK